MAWLTSWGAGWCEGCAESCSIFFLVFEIDGAIFCVIVDFAAMVHPVWRFYCAWASAMPPAMV
jgi:hypothetical protein